MKISNKLKSYHGYLHQARGRIDLIAGILG
ncbi:hypothetical protein FHU23_001196 [Clostridium saccharobutylicum]|nr:hypothetical protein [Clostridium saccharobutylicum]MBA8789153.1 hypothetical protein [Clostridium saccharobutylicum]MBA8895841.1 hypothetical protein [Clostridium saccharobutylicum]MBA8993367.1 hypothetical protein [Clostridium saccharobutylicum]NOV66194.1 hypothetical protein [Clostridium saccharobutylicum]